MLYLFSQHHLQGSPARDQPDQRDKDPHIRYTGTSTSHMYLLANRIREMQPVAGSSLTFKNSNLLRNSRCKLVLNSGTVHQMTTIIFYIIHCPFLTKTNKKRTTTTHIQPQIKSYAFWLICSLNKQFSCIISHLSCRKSKVIQLFSGIVCKVFR